MFIKVKGIDLPKRFQFGLGLACIWTVAEVARLSTAESFTLAIETVASSVTG